MIQRGEPPLVLILDSLEDPQNVGTLLRSAEAARSLTGRSRRVVLGSEMTIRYDAAQLAPRKKS